MFTVLYMLKENTCKMNHNDAVYVGHLMHDLKFLFDLFVIEEQNFQYFDLQSVAFSGEKF